MKNILQYLESSAARHPQRYAVCEEGFCLTFEELLAQARIGGSFLAHQGRYREPVIVFMRKSPKMVAAFFAVIYAGCCYVPMEESIPPHRRKMIAEKLEGCTVICDETTMEVASQYGNTILYDELVSGAEDERLLCKIREKQIDTDPTYIVFTSGSTGTPKGVTGCHRAVIDYAEQLCSVIGTNEGTVFGMQVPLYVDACLKELLGVIKCGAEAWLMPQSLFTSPVRTVEFLNTHKINTICWVASAMTLVSGLGAFEEVMPQYLKTVCFGSEVFPVKQLALWRSACPNARFFNLYGPTEVTGMSFYYEVCRDFAEGEAIPVGKPFENTGFLLLSDEDQEVEDGQVGEICLRGTPLTLGYYDDPDRTASAFCQNPLHQHYPEQIYRTGDLGYVDTQGNLVFVSRKDFQIKHMGHRIELGEIEAYACSLDGVENACCLWQAEEKKLRLFYMGGLAERNLLAALRSGLPRYMQPRKVIQLPLLPMLPNGKIDRNALKEIK